ncbi:YceI family protein [Povalibacter sp.]|uniref:YceI family protein n=1 Tax=Povalibacter sp. TaxID=1962978 RepID=UPI002F42C6A2
MKSTNFPLILVAAIALSACSKQPVPAATPQPATTTPAAVESAPVDVPGGAYTLDKSHASLLFRVDHLGFSNYTARFLRFDATLTFDPANLAASSATVTVDPRSLETDYPDVAKLDFNAQLQSEQWLNSAQYPQMTWQSTSVEVLAPRRMKLHGDLTLRGVTRPVTLDATFNGGYAGHPMDPNARIGFSARGTLNRSDFGMGYGIPEAGSTMGVSDAVEVIIEAEFSGPPLASAATE